ncbi:MAG: histidine kinase, partial [Dehalococcoidales bacterium]|nr:histidine kinase [Dehalococcoidales bacterium]
MNDKNGAGKTTSPSVPFTRRIGRIIPAVRFNTIRARLTIASIVMVLVAVIAISSVTFVVGVREGRQRVIDQLESVVTLKQAEIRSWVNGISINLDIVTSDYGELNDILTLTDESADAEEKRTAYDRLYSRFNWAVDSMGLFDELFLMDTSGRVVLSTSQSHVNEKHTIYDYFTEGQKGLYIQQPSYSLFLKRMGVVASAPVTDNGILLGVIAGRASLQSLNDIMIERAGLGDTGETYLVGTNHRLLTDLRDEAYTIPVTYVRTRGATAAIDQHLNGSANYKNYSGENVIGVYRWLPELKVALLAEQEEGEALSATSLAMMITGLVSLAALILVIIAVAYLTRSIVRPLAEMASTAKLIAEGDLDKTARIERDDEVGIVAGAFNSMTARLRDLVRSLERRTDHLKAINDTGRHLSSLLHLNELLPYVASSLQKSFNYHNVGIILVDQKTGTLSLRSHAGAYEGGQDVSKGTFDAKSIVSTVAQTGKVLVIKDVLKDPQYRSEGAGNTRAELVVPIKISGRLVGILDIEEDHTDAFDDLDVFTAQTLADQLAIAIENAHLYEQAEELATLKERQRLARDLHDAVSQTLFSASLISEVLPRLWERNPDEGKRRLEEIRMLTRGALAEMRTLLLELRPAALADANLGDLLRLLGDSVTGRARIPVTVSIDGDCP